MSSKTGIWLKVKGIQETVSEKGRVQVQWEDNQKYSLDVQKIITIKFDSQFYYVLYNTTNVEFYKKYISNPPEYAVDLKFEVKEKTVGGRCPNCNLYYPLDVMEEIEFADGVAYCTKCLDQTGDFYYLDEIRKKVFELTFPVKKETSENKYVVIDEIVNNIAKQFNAEFVAKLYDTIAGGKRVKWEKLLEEKEIASFEVEIGINPTIEETHYDEIEVKEQKLQGKYLVIKYFPFASDMWINYLYKIKET